MIDIDELDEKELEEMETGIEGKKESSEQKETNTKSEIEQTENNDEEVTYLLQSAFLLRFCKFDCTFKFLNNRFKNKNRFERSMIIWIDFAAQINLLRISSKFFSGLGFYCLTASWSAKKSIVGD